MRALHLNLASRPFRDYRPVWMVVASMGVISMILVLYNAHTAYRYFVNTKTTRTEIDRLQRQTTTERRRTESLQSEVKNVDRKKLNNQSEFINAQIAERAFSWSGLLDHLEGVVPRDVRLLSLNPSISKEGTRLHMTCVAKSSNGMVEMLRRTQSNPHFIGPFPQSETMLENGLHQFSIETTYRPDPIGILR